MSSLGSSQRLSFNTGNAVQLQSDDSASTSKQTSGTATKTYAVKGDADSRVAQSKLVTEISKRKLLPGNVKADNLISEKGLKVALGKAGNYANLKDKVLRGAYKMMHHTKADETTGSLHKSAVRLADKYQQLAKNGGTEAELISVLRELRDTLQEMQDKHQAGGGGAKQNSEAFEKNLDAMLQFVDHEISARPGTHLDKGRHLLMQASKDIQDPSVSRQDKIALLEAVQDELLAAKKGLPDSDEVKNLLSRVEDKIAQLKHDDFVQARKGDKAAVVQQKSLGKEIRGFDRSTLSHVTPRESNALNQAKAQVHIGSVDDDLVQIGNQPLTNKTPTVKDPTLSQLGTTLTGDPKFAAIGSQILKALGSSQTLQDMVAKDLGDLINTALRSKSDDIQTGFITSDGAAFKKELINHLQTALGTSASGLLESDGQPKASLTRLLDAAYSHAVTHLKNAYVDDKTLNLDGVTYTKVKDLGDGGFGSVALYEGTRSDGTKDQIAVKIAKIQTKGKPEEVAARNKAIFESNANEARVLRQAGAGGHQNVIGYRAAIQTPDGRLLIAMEKAPHGDLGNLAAKLKSAVDAGTISQHAANLIRITMLRDMLSGLKEIQQRGITHIDLKSPNLFIGEGGVLKMADFGTGAVNLKREFDSSPVDNPLYLAPEMVAQKKARKEVTDDQKDVEKTKKHLDEELAKAKGELSPQDFDALQKEVDGLKQKQDDLINDALSGSIIKVGSAADVWSIGITAHELFFGDLPFESSFFSQVEDMLVDFAQDKTNRISPLGKDKQGNLQGTGATALDRLLNQMLHPDPKMRPTAETLLEHSLFNEAGVGEQEVRDLLVLLTDENTTDQQLRNASNQLGV